MRELKSGDIGLTRNGKVVHLQERPIDRDYLGPAFSLRGKVGESTRVWMPGGYFFGDRTISEWDIVAVAVPLTPYNKPSLGKYLTATGAFVSVAAFHETEHETFILGAGIGPDAKITHKFVPLEDLPNEEPAKEEFRITGPGRYETRGVGVAYVETYCPHSAYAWRGSAGNGHSSWTTDGHYAQWGTDHPFDLVKRLPDIEDNPTPAEASVKYDEVEDAPPVPNDPSLLDLAKKCATRAGHPARHVYTFPDGRLLFVCQRRDMGGREFTRIVKPNGIDPTHPYSQSRRIVNVEEKKKTVVHYVLVFRADGKKPISLGRHPHSTKENAEAAADMIGWENIQAIARLEWEE